MLKIAVSAVSHLAVSSFLLAQQAQPKTTSYPPQHVIRGGPDRAGSPPFPYHRERADCGPLPVPLFRWVRPNPPHNRNNPSAHSDFLQEQAKREALGARSEKDLNLAFFGARLSRALPTDNMSNVVLTQVAELKIDTMAIH
jgi:hypothetical protein